MKNEYKFNIIKPIVDGKYVVLSNLRNSIFLAGPCPRDDFRDDWRYDAFDILDDLGFTGNVITPSNPEYKTFEIANNLSHEAMLRRQTAWERIAMYSASAIVFWIPRDEAHPARTTNIEFGEWYKKDGTFFGWPEDALHNEYIGLKLKEQGKAFSSTLEETLKNAVDALNRPSTLFFTSDTHFKQQRTLELSRRPFVDVDDMDLTMISNWNKKVTMNDIVYHAGDFIDIDHLNQLKSLLSSLNFKELHWTLGNYDRKAELDILRITTECAKSTGRLIKVYDTGDCKVTSPSGKTFVIVHEPNDFEYDIAKDEIVLFGHIHGRSFAKRNGFDIASDYHQYAPLSIDQVEWFVNAMKYWDENVYSDHVNTTPK